MAADSIPLKQCSRKEKCVNPQGSWLPATSEYFQPSAKYKSGFVSQCRACRLNNTHKWRETHREYCREYASTYTREHKDALNAIRREHRRASPETFRQKDNERYCRDRNRIRERQERWRDNNPEKVALHKAKDYERHAESYKSRAHKHRLENPQKKYEDNKRWAILNPEKVRQSRRQWKQNNPLKVVVHSTLRRARIIDADGWFLTDDINRLYEEQEGRCFYCGITLHKCYEIEHMQPLSRGGSNWPHNLCLSCPQCNYSKGKKTVDEWYSARGW